MKDNHPTKAPPPKSTNMSGDIEGCLHLIALPFEILGMLLVGLLSFALSLLAAAIPIAIAIFLALWAYKVFLAP